MFTLLFCGISLVLSGKQSRLLQEEIELFPIDPLPPCCRECYSPLGVTPLGNPCPNPTFGQEAGCGCEDTLNGKRRIKVGGTGPYKNLCVRPKNCPNNPCKNYDKCDTSERCVVKFRNGKIKPKCVKNCAAVTCLEGFTCLPRLGRCVPNDIGLNCANILCLVGTQCIDGKCVPIECGINKPCPLSTQCNPLTEECELVNCAAVTCPEEQECDPNTGNCIISIECKSDLECELGEKCNLLTNKCEEVNCAAITCPVGKQCDPNNGFCIPVSCKTGNDCPLGSTCNGITNQCAIINCAAITCPVGQACDPQLGCVTSPCSLVRCPNLGTNKPCIDDYDEEGNLVANCCGTRGERYNECSTCDRTCDNPFIICAAVCGPPKCQCRLGLYRTTEGECVDIEEC